MPITWGERPKSPDISSVNPASETLHYVLTGTTNGAMAKLLAVGYSAALYGNLFRKDISVKPQGFDVWFVDVKYGPQKQPEAGDMSWSFDTTGGTKHITQALEHIASYPSPGNAPIDHNGAIGVTENGDIEGVDVIDKAFKWTEHHQLLLASFGWSYAEILGDLTGGVNDASFRGKAVGTVMFEGASGTQSTKDPLLLDVTFNFDHSRSVTGQVVGPITGVAKKGWEYVWVEYETQDGGAAKKLVKKPRQANVERVCENVDFSLLGIGT